MKATLILTAAFAIASIGFAENHVSDKHRGTQTQHADSKKVEKSATDKSTKPTKPSKTESSKMTKTSSPLDFKMVDIDGNEVDLAKYKGKVVLIVNVASKCGLTGQYTQLQELYEEYSEKGLAVLGFPANNFMGQEPGSNEEIKTFCVTKYNVGFDMFAKISVKGKDQHPLYAYLTAKDAGHEFGGPVRWNFGKFLVGRDGQLIGRFSPRTKPDAKEVVTAIETALKKESA